MAMLALLRGGGVREPCRKHATRKALREVFKWGCDPTVTYAMRDPTFGVPYIRVETEGFHTWTVEDVLQYLNYHRPFSRAGRALGILLFTGAARCDVVNFGRQHVSNGRLKYRRDKTSVPIDVPVLPELQASIEATPVGNLTFIVTEFGRPFTPLGFGNRVRAWCDEAGLPHCFLAWRSQGGRDHRGQQRRERASPKAIFGQETIKQADLYTKRANRARLADMGININATKSIGCATIAKSGKLRKMAGTT
jgi:hypothetical protein